MTREKVAGVRIDIDQKSGFCTGVINAVKRAEEILENGGELRSLGSLVHNPLEVERLEQLGLGTLSYDEFDQLEGGTVLVRAHGEPPVTYDKAERQNITLLDATCPIVRKLQERIRKDYSANRESGGTIFIFGKTSHPEVGALVGQTEGTAIVVRDPADLPDLELESPVSLYSQTTMSTREFEKFAGMLRREMETRNLDMTEGLQVHNTVCGQVSSRESYLKKFVAEYELVFFVSGKQSSNGKALYAVCKEVNPATHFISTPEESGQVDIKGICSIGICGATSTPGWLLESVKQSLIERLKITGT